MRYCSCGENQSEIIPATGEKENVDCNHDWEIVTTNPTCTTSGYDTKTCKLCEEKVITNITEPTKHSYVASYTIDNDYHCLMCIYCSDSNSKQLHSLDNEGICTICQFSLSSTPGIIYDVSSDGTYAEVISYKGTAAILKIAEEYNGLPVKTIWPKAFEHCPNLTSVLIPNTIVCIPGSAFSGCYNLTSIIIPNSVTSIDNDAFTNCSSLTSIIIPNSVTSISINTFGYCYSLTSIIIPDSVTTIGHSAFYDCNKLTSIVIPDSVTSIGDYAFEGCSSLKDVYYTGSKEEWNAIEISENENLTNATIHFDYVP